MSFFTYHSRHSWPPFNTSKEPSSPTNIGIEIDDIDDDPFSHFLSPPAASIDIFLNDDVSDAGIESRAGSKSCTLAPFRLERSAEADSSVTKASKTTSAVLRRWAAYVERAYPSLHLQHHPPTTIPVRTVSQPNLRRMAERAPEYSRGRSLTRPNRQQRVRSHSDRPRSWAKPSGHLFVLVEEDEGAGLESHEFVDERMAASAFDLPLPVKPASPPNSVSWMCRHFGGRRALSSRL